MSREICSQLQKKDGKPKTSLLTKTCAAVLGDAFKPNPSLQNPIHSGKTVRTIGGIRLNE